jgi:hypothetical protein
MRRLSAGPDILVGPMQNAPESIVVQNVRSSARGMVTLSVVRG